MYFAVLICPINCRDRCTRHNYTLSQTAIAASGGGRRGDRRPAGFDSSSAGHSCGNPTGAWSGGLGVIVLGGVVGHLVFRKAAGNRDGLRRRRLLRPPRAARRRRVAVSVPIGRRREYPDPVSRWQPEGVHRPSAVFFPESFPGPMPQWQASPARPRRSTNCTSARSRPRARSRRRRRACRNGGAGHHGHRDDAHRRSFPASATGATTASIPSPRRTATAGRGHCSDWSTPPIAPDWR